MTKETIKKIKEVLPYHMNYDGHRNGSKYLDTVSYLAKSLGYKGAIGVKVSLLMQDYYKAIGVKNLNEAIATHIKESKV